MFGGHVQTVIYLFFSRFFDPAVTFTFDLLSNLQFFCGVHSKYSSSVFS